MIAVFTRGTHRTNRCQEWKRKNERHTELSESIKDDAFRYVHRETYIFPETNGLTRGRFAIVVCVVFVAVYV